MLLSAGLPCASRFRLCVGAARAGQRPTVHWVNPLPNMSMTGSALALAAVTLANAVQAGLFFLVTRRIAKRILAAAGAT